MSLPSWLTEDYIQKAFQEFHKDDQLRVQKVCAKPATGKGENFVGVMTRIYVDFQHGDGTKQKQSYILKQAVSSDAPQAKIFAEYDVYNRELDMYDIVLPKMSKILQEAAFNDKLMAEAIVVDRERTVMILEDLAPLRYTNADRVKQLDMAHTKLVLDMMAKFHAAAIILNQREPDLLSRNYSSHFFSRGKKGYGQVFVGLFKAFIRYVKTKPNLKNRYANKLDNIVTNLMEYAAKSVDVGEKDLQTLVHGDCWTTNVMYLYDDEGNPTTVLPIDFQFSTWTSPAVDLHYFFSTSLKSDVKAEELELVQYHYYALKSTLEALSYKGSFPSLVEYQLQFEKRRFLSLIIANVFQPIMVYQGNEDCDFINFYRETAEAIKFQDSMYENEEIQTRIDTILPILDAKGFLEAH
ncbi:GD19842 [Drosophila simulans]|uniref:GD19842 n=1 Tax=Drosophila simulans TaxID=7240 RepID=B4QXP7_DROSI|nr:GD19842 [Drosophila simulans]